MTHINMWRNVRKYSPLLLFISLTLLFFYSLKSTVKKYENSAPVAKDIPKRKLTERQKRLKALYDQSLQWSSYSKRRKMENLHENPVYANFKIKREPKKKVNFLLVVSSGPKYFDRRQAIRETWWTQCVEINGVVPKCVFFTDRQKPSGKYYAQIEAESTKYGDMYFQPLRGGVEFGMRLLHHLVWAMTNYEFDYFLRIDDDYFLCLERLLYELPPPQPRFHWGFVHCIQELVRPEESILLLSRDLVEIFLRQPPQTLRCHPLADQMIGVWVTDLELNNLYRHDDRLHHAPIVDGAPELRQRQDVCHTFIGIHGTYAKDMRGFWQRRGSSFSNFTSAAERESKIGNLISNSEVCELVHNFNYLRFEPEWQYEPQRCIFDPIWDTGKHAVVDGVYVGRQGDVKLQNDDIKNFVKKKYRINV